MVKRAKAKTFSNITVNKLRYPLARLVPFGLASKTDKRPTVTAYNLIGYQPVVGTKYKIRVCVAGATKTGKASTFDLIVRTNRSNSVGLAPTLVPQTWPKNLRLPKVGKPVKFLVLDRKVL